MKRLIIISKLILTSVFVLNGQSIQQLQNLAASYYQNNQFKESSKLYERIFYFKNEPTSNDLFLLAECKSKLNEYESAIYYYNLAINKSNIDTLKAYYYIKISRIFIFTERYYEAIQMLLISESLANNKQLQRIRFLLGSSYFLVDDYLNSKLYFNQIIKDKEKLSSLFAYTERRYPNANKAFWLSTIMPGSGQFYLGDIKDGINSLLVNAALVGLFIYTANESSFISASFSISPWLHRFITGGAANAERNANTKRQLNNKLILNKIINLYSNKDVI